MTLLVAARLELDGRHISGLGYSLDDARLVARLKSKKSVASLYTGKRDGQIQELARHLARARATRYLFHVNNETLGATAKLISELSLLRDGCEVFFWGFSLDDWRTTQSLPDHVKMVNGQSVFEVAGALLSMDGLVVEDMTKADPSYSPYLCGLLAIEQASRLGLKAEDGLEVLKSELQWVEENRLSVSEPIYLALSAKNVQVLNHCVNIIADLGITEIVHINVYGCSDTESELERKYSDIDKKGVVVRASAEPLCEGYRSEWRAQKTDDVSANTLADVYAFNGILAYRLGAYADIGRNASPAIHHLHISGEAPISLRKEIYRSLGSHMAIRSAVLLHGQHADVGSAEVESAVDGVAEWPKHVYQLAPTHVPDVEKAVIDGRDIDGKFIFNVALKDAVKNGAPNGSTPVVSIRDDKDIEVLLAKLDKFHSVGEIDTHLSAQPMLFENGCRWSRFGACKIANLRRIQIDEVGNARTCIDSGDIGNFTIPYEKMLLDVKQQKQMEESRRGCAVCPVRADCSHCSSLPHSLGGRYCEIRQKYPHSSLYFELLNFPYLVSKLLKGLGGALTLRASYGGLPTQLYGGIRGEKRSGAIPDVVIVSLNDQYIAWWRGSQRMLLLSKPLALIYESWREGGDEVDVVIDLQNRFDVTKDVAKESYKQAIRKLLEGGLVSG